MRKYIQEKETIEKLEGKIHLKANEELLLQ
jgi:hypothetical protein